MKYRLTRVAAFLTLTAITGCGGGISGSTGVIDRMLPPIGEADRIEVRHGGELEPFLQIAEPSRIRELRQFVNSYPAGWSVPFAGPPAGHLYFEFYFRGKFVGNFYVGPGFFGRDDDDFYSMSASGDEIAKFTSIVGFDVLE